MSNGLSELDSLTVADNNPAGRLHRILAALRQADKTESHMQVWARVLFGKGRTPDALEVLAAYFEVAKLPEAVRKALKDAEVKDVPLFTQHLRLASKLFVFQNIMNKWENTSQLITNEMMMELQFASRELARHPQSEQPIPHDKLDQIQKEISSLRHDVTSAEELDADVKEFVHRHLHRLEHGLALYRIKGSEGLLESTFGSMGEIATIVRRNDHRLSTDKKKSYIRRLAEIIVTTHAAVDAAVGIKTLAPGTADAAVLLFNAFGQ